MRLCLEGPVGQATCPLGQGLSPREMFLRMAASRGVAYLASPPGFGRLSRYSILGCDPAATLAWAGDAAAVEGLDLPSDAMGNPFSALRAFIRAARAEANGPHGLLLGTMGYDLKRYVERLPETAVADDGLPEMHFGYYPVVVVHDNSTGETFLMGDQRCGTAAERLASLVREGAFPKQLSAPLRTMAPLRSNFTRDDYLQAVRAARNYIYDGDIFQVNLSQRFETRMVGHPAALFDRLMEVNPAPFAAYLALDGESAVLCSSPERFLRVADGVVETRPIKGTRRRCGEARADELAARDLLASAKDNAELAMIVDLERNDLGRVADYGTVKVTEPRVIETYPTVFHLVSTITAKLHRDKDIVDLLRATFPGGSITGAPKVRAMEIIDELEPTRRSVYTGTIGYISLDGRADLNIVIRTLLYERGRVTFQVGGGIVADSSPEAEYEETLDKGRALARSLGLEL